MSSPKVYLNGKIVPLEAASIPVTDRGFLYGDGIFESLRTYQNIPFQLDEHLQRLASGLKTLQIPLPLAMHKLKQVVLNIIDINNFKETYLKIIVSRGNAQSHGLDPSQSSKKPTLIILAEEQKELPENTYTKGWQAMISTIIKADLPSTRIKSLCYLDNLLAKLEARKSGAQEAFMLDTKGHLTEGTVSNVFIIKYGIIYTPATETAFLPGVTRNLVIKLAKRNGFKLMERTLTSKELYAADECFITFSGAGIVPITSIWKRKVGTGMCGKITAQLIALYAQETQSL